VVASQAGHLVRRRSTPNRSFRGVPSWGVRILAIGLMTLTAGAAGPAMAGAEVGAGPYPTSQAVAADAQFLEYAPPPAQPGVVCLVDSGVDPNPDTTVALVGAEAEGTNWGAGDGLAQTLPLVEGHPAGHGTEMAMLMAAPLNGWGMVGIAPTSVRVYSIRVVPPGETGFPFSAYSYGISRCLQLKLTSEPAITVINLSLAEVTTPTRDDLAELADSVDAARHVGIDVVAAAGNDAPNGPYYPAAYPSVLAVAASDAATVSLGVLCAFSQRLDVGTLAPGCDTVTGGIDQVFEDDGTAAFGFGTSQAAAVTSATLAAMRSYMPSVTDSQAETCLKASEQNGGNIDVAGAFRSCGLDRVVRAGAAAVPLVSSVPTDVAENTPPSHTEAALPTRALVAPHLARLHRRRRRLVVRVLNRPKGAAIELKVLARRGRGLVVVARRTTTASRVIFTLPTVTVVRARFVTHGSNHLVSPWVTKPVK
jgi:hypothetical protein